MNICPTAPSVPQGGQGRAVNMRARTRPALNYRVKYPERDILNFLNIYSILHCFTPLDSSHQDEFNGVKQCKIEPILRKLLLTGGEELTDSLSC